MIGIGKRSAGWVYVMNRRVDTVGLHPAEPLRPGGFGAAFCAVLVVRDEAMIG